MLTFVIPFAGGTPLSYIKWTQYDLDFMFLELPGKGKRRNEKSADSIHSLAQDVKEQIYEAISKNKCAEYAIWGHSMGSYIAYELLVLIERERRPLPKEVILSGTVAPNRIETLGIDVKLCGDEDFFLNYLESFGMINEMHRNNSIMRKMYLPIILNDYKILSACIPSKTQKLPIRTLILNGYDDDITDKDIRC